jgi:hypothetical protein
MVAPPVPPRDLPVQDHKAIDDAELTASRLTVILGALAAAVLVVMVAVLCGQLLP